MRVGLFLAIVLSACWSEDSPLPCSDCGSAGIFCEPAGHDKIRCNCGADPDPDAVCVLDQRSASLAQKCEVLNCEWAWCPDDAICVCLDINSCPER